MKTMTMTTLEQTLAALEEAVAERGEDYVYDEHDDGGHCVYVKDGRPSCLVGNALVKLGVITVEELVPFETKSANYVTRALNAPVAVQAALCRAQAVQDDGEPWGAALEQAKRVAEKNG